MTNMGPGMQMSTILFEKVSIPHLEEYLEEPEQLALHSKASSDNLMDTLFERGRENILKQRSPGLVVIVEGSGHYTSFGDKDIVYLEMYYKGGEWARSPSYSGEPTQIEVSLDDDY
ncbi:hypothetical protein FRB96_008527 [Tulasnella sp. 330]|nr:hypothetical protein FRB96_008527 [Tulasnella sp. 330]